MCRVARMVNDHLWEILDAIHHSVTNALAGSLNAKVQWLKCMPRGYRNCERFRNAVYFHPDGLDLYPTDVAR